MRPDLQAVRTAARDLISRDRTQSESDQHLLEQDYDRSLRDLLNSQEESLRLVCEQQEKLRRDMLASCEREVQLLKAANALQGERLRGEMDVQRRRLRKDRDAKAQLHRESLVALEGKQKAQLAELKAAMEDSVQERKIEEERKRGEALGKYGKDLEGRLEAQVSDIAKKLDCDNGEELERRREELTADLSVLQAQIVSIKTTLSTPVPTISVSQPVLPAALSASTQTDKLASPGRSPLQQTLEASGKALVLQLDQVETALLQLISNTQTRTIDLEGRILRVARWRTELEQMAQELD